MANIKSAKKRILVNETKAARNKAIRSKVKTACKKVEAAVTAGDKAAAQTALLAATSEIDKASTVPRNSRRSSIAPCTRRERSARPCFQKGFPPL